MDHKYGYSIHIPFYNYHSAVYYADFVTKRTGLRTLVVKNGFSAPQDERNVAYAYDHAGYLP